MEQKTQKESIIEKQFLTLTNDTLVLKHFNRNKIKKVIITQPNYSRYGKRSWKMPPYGLAILNACIKKHFDSEIFDPDYDSLSDEEIYKILREKQPDVVCVGTISTEFYETTSNMTHIIRKALPNSIIIEGGVLPTTGIKVAMKDKNVNYWIIGEGEINFPQLLNELDKQTPYLLNIKGLAYWDNGVAKINPQEGFIQDLDSIPFADYGGLNYLNYGNHKIKFGQGICARRFPYTTSITSRGCPFKCTFCASSAVAGNKVRIRSAENVLAEIDHLHSKGIKEVIFLDDNFFVFRNRAIKIVKGIIERKNDPSFDMTWKICNLMITLLDEEMIDLLIESGMYQMTVSIESGNEYVLEKLIKKPMPLDKAARLCTYAHKKGMEIIANFVIGHPYETWDQIQDSVEYAGNLDVDLVSFHIATPLPKTELYDICVKEGIIKENFDENGKLDGYCIGKINTNTWTAEDLMILRAYEWDRINFRTQERKERIARIQGITLEELEKWRMDTRKKLGVRVVDS